MLLTGFPKPKERDNKLPDSLYIPTINASHADSFAIRVGGDEKHDVFVGDTFSIDNVTFDGEITLKGPHRIFTFKNEKEARLYKIGAKYVIAEISPTIDTSGEWMYRLLFKTKK